MIVTIDIDDIEPYIVSAWNSEEYFSATWYARGYDQEFIEEKGGEGNETFKVLIDMPLELL